MIQKVSGLKAWLQVWSLYRQAFPRDERKPFWIFVRLWRMGKSDVWCIWDERKFAGFASTIFDDRLVMIDYLAIKRGRRGAGVGTKALLALQQAYEGRGVFVEIESVFENTPDQALRLRRKQFYLTNGFEDMHVLADVFGVPMELLAWRCSVDFETYKAFYRDNYSPWAASHLSPMDYPQS